VRGNSFGKLFSITSFGESHGEAMGAIIDGVPAGLEFSLEILQAELDRRAPGRSEVTTSRVEPDQAQVLSGIFEGVTLGTPISVIVSNLDQQSSDYDKLKNEYRPGHADKTTLLKYGVRDHRGGGRASGRETLCRVIGGYFAGLIIPKIEVRSKISQLGEISHPDMNSEKVKNLLLDCKKQGESLGGKVQIEIDNCPPGLGEPCFDKLKADFAKAFLSIGSCVGFSYGIGEEFSRSKGTQVTADSNNFGGMEGGISNGEKILMTLDFRPPSTVGEKAREGRHDPCILLRVLPVVESMAKIVLADHTLRQRAYQI